MFIEGQRRTRERYTHHIFSVRITVMTPLCFVSHQTEVGVSVSFVGVPTSMI